MQTLSRVETNVSPAAGVDYVPLSETVTFSLSSTENEICRSVSLIDDNFEESDETFDVQISQSSCLLSTTVASVVIVDDGKTNYLIIVLIMIMRNIIIVSTNA